MPQVTIDQMLSNLDTHFGRRYSLDTIRNVKSQSIRFLQRVGVKPSYSRADLLGYMDYLIEYKYRPRSITVIIGEIKQLLLANGIPWPLIAGDFHLGIPKGETLSPMLSNEDIKKLVAGTRNLGLPDGPMIALSTIYGLRATEITSTLNAGVNGHLLVIQSAKGGEVRRHVIPNIVKKLLNFEPYKISRDTTQRVFARIMKAHCRLPKEHEGLHAVRRSVVTGLKLNGIDNETIYNFMGWRRNDIISRYFHPDMVKIDLDVYKAHPFLPFYRED